MTTRNMGAQTRDRLGVLVYLILLALFLLVAYRLELAEINSSLGYRLFTIDGYYLVMSATGVLASALCMPVNIEKPSDFFGLFYGLFVLVPYAVLYQMGGGIEAADFFLRFAILLLPVLAVRMVASVIPSLRLPGLISLRTMTCLLASACCVGLVIAFANAPGSASFDLLTSYERRLEGRKVFVTGSLLAYANSMISNGFAPFIAFVAGWRFRLNLFLFALAIAFGYYFLLGLKAPLLFALLAASIGYAVRVNKIHQLGIVVIICLLAIFAIFFVEHMFTDYSYVGNYFIRRAFSVPPHLISGYFELLASPPGFSWDYMYGIGEGGSRITYIVGARMFPQWEATNANTNAFILQLVSRGVFMYLATIALVVSVFALLDAVYASNENPVLMYVGYCYASLLPEQSATTALLSSGVGALVALGVFSYFVFKPPSCKPAHAA